MAIVAIFSLLLSQVPPVVGDKVVVELTQIFVGPVTLMAVGSEIVRSSLASEGHPVVLIVYIK